MGSRFYVIIFLLVLGVNTSIVDAAPIVFTKITDTTTSVPGGSIVFTEFGIPGQQPSPPAIDGNNIAFVGASGSKVGLYLSSSGSISRIADTTSLIPNGTATFSGFYTPAISGHSMVFRGTSGTAAVQNGIYKDLGAGLKTVANTSTSVPSGTGLFAGFSVPDITGSSVYVYGDGAGVGNDGVYTDAGGTLHPIADSNTPVPGSTGNFDSLNSNVAAAGNDVAFYGHASQTSGIYRTLNGSLIRIADTHTAVPGKPGKTFFQFIGNGVAFDGSETMFSGSDGTTAGLYRTFGGSTIKIIESGEVISGFGTLNFGAIGGIAFEKGHTSFLFNGTLFSDLNGSLEPVIGNGQQLFGKTIQSLGFGQRSFDGQSIAFAAKFTDESTGIYVANVPAPSLLPAAGLALICSAKRRRSTHLSIS